MQKEKPCLPQGIQVIPANYQSEVIFMNHDFISENRIDMTDYSNSNTDIHTSKYTLNESFPAHWHDHYEFEYYIKGKGCQIINGSSFPIVPGTLCIFSPTDFHEIIVEEPLEMLKFEYQESDIDPLVSSLFAGFPTGSPIHLDENNVLLFNHLFYSAILTAEMYPDSPYGKTVIRKLVESVILNTINRFAGDNIGIEFPPSMQFGDIQGVLAYIHKNFTNHITLKEVAKNTHFSPQYLCKLFHQKMGISFKEYITNLQMNYASKLLINTDQSVTDICYKSGFGSFPNFTRKFKKFYSISPSDYRKANRSLKGKSKHKKEDSK
ncbi:MAG: helix-turn-helix domain-containing protein [Ruminococcaceae bacterium]|nr:helix-turn-helix domain-containing protein [Oscillospiraceae bacterium]